MRPRPKPTWLDWPIVAVTIVAVVLLILGLASLGGGMPSPG
jgi:hypothetical protein